MEKGVFCKAHPKNHEIGKKGGTSTGLEGVMILVRIRPICSQTRSGLGNIIMVGTMGNVHHTMRCK